MEVPLKTQPAKWPPLASKTILRMVLSLGSWMKLFTFSITSLSFEQLSLSLRASLSFSYNIFSDSSKNKHFQTETLSPVRRRIYNLCFKLSPDVLCKYFHLYASFSSSSSEPDMLDISSSWKNESDVNSSKSSSFRISFPARLRFT